jgi:hypothetical protein
MATQRQINLEKLDSNFVRAVNKYMKKLNDASDTLYESFIDEDFKSTIVNCDKVIDATLDIRTKAQSLSTNK